MKKKTLLIFTTALCICLSGSVYHNAYAETNFMSSGRIRFDNSTTDTTDDVIFDADDLKTLNSKIMESENKITNIEKEINEKKKELINILNENPNIQIAEESNITLDEIITYIEGITVVPENTYFYEEGTEGDENIVTYKKVDGKYYRCDQYGRIAEGTKEADISQISLKGYKGTTAANQTAGSAAYANGNFYLGNGSDNAAYANQVKQQYIDQGRQEGIAQTKVGTATSADVLVGKTFTNATGVGISGSMKNNSAWTNIPTTEGKVTIPVGYHNGSGYVDTTAVYNKGMADADARVNTNSESYKQGVQDTILVRKNVIELGTGTSFDIKNQYTDYQTLTTSNFYIQPAESVNTSNWHQNANLGNTVGSYGIQSLSSSINISYNPNTGILTASLTASAAGGANSSAIAGANGTASVKAYLIY